jgi:hypothetical protein
LIDFGEPPPSPAGGGSALNWPSLRWRVARSLDPPYWMQISASRVRK